MFLFGIERGIGDERCKWQLEKEWMVTPPALMAAIPVGATMTVRLGDSFFRLCRKVVFPVPAFPVRKRWVPVFSIICQARCSSGLFIIS